ncbi:DnaB-like helicase N-terminal domain-containing protein, partial [Providencia rettgeri]|nr:DnaB-like helicase N-terminal domain-containing protein [Providencia rettgeri]
MTNNIFAPPNSAEAEQAVLGGLMISTDEDKRQRVISLIKPESFYQWAHNRIFSEIVRLIKTNQPTDVCSGLINLATWTEVICSPQNNTGALMKKRNFSAEFRRESAQLV